MKKYLLGFLFLILGLGCARVRVEAPKEPIRVDVSMRLDIYQHIQKDIDQIENMVSGEQKKTPVSDQRSFLGYLVRDAYASEGLDPEVEKAVANRRDRRSSLAALEGQGVIGENKFGLVEVRLQNKATRNVEDLVRAENQDRMTIYQSVAEKNGSSVQEVQRLYAKRLQADAPIGTPIQIADENGSYVWKTK